MAIDPSIVITVRADQLPVAPLENESIIMHAVGETLYQASISELIALLPTSAYKPYETKILCVTDLYIEENFETEGANKGLAKLDGLWPGWAIMDGVHGTENMDGAIPLGYGATYNSMRAEVGENTKVLVKGNIPKMDLTVPVSDGDSGGGAKIYVMANDVEAAGNHTYTNSVNATSANTAVSIMQKSRVFLYIMKLP